MGAESRKSLSGSQLSRRCVDWHHGRKYDHHLFLPQLIRFPRRISEMEQMLEQAEAVLRFSGEVQRRMSEVGVEGIGGVMGLYAKLRSALERVSHDELDWAAAEVNRVLDSLNRINDELKRLKSLKLSLETGH